MKKIVILEVVDSIRELLEEVLKEQFPGVSVVSVTREQYAGDITSLFWAEQPVVAFIPGEVRPWKNQDFGSEGTQLLGVLKTILPDTLFVFSAVDTVYVDKAIYMKLAHEAYQKGDLLKSMDAVRLHLEMH